MNSSDDLGPATLAVVRYAAHIPNAASTAPLALTDAQRRAWAMQVVQGVVNQRVLDCEFVAAQSPDPLERMRAARHVSELRKALEAVRA